MQKYLNLGNSFNIMLPECYKDVSDKSHLEFLISSEITRVRNGKMDKIGHQIVLRFSN